MRPFLALGLLAGCSGSTSSSSDSGGFTSPVTSDTQTGSTVTDTTTITIPAGLNGEEPDSNLPLPAFTQVLAQDGTSRAPADLLGLPTVMWFYPAAMTGG